MSYTGPNFVNDGPPAINAANLNGMVDQIEADSNDIEKNVLASSHIFINSSTKLSQYPDANSFPNNKMILVAKNQAASLLNTPWTDRMFTIIVTGYAKNQTSTYGGSVQIAIPCDPIAESIKIRFYNGAAWKGWAEVKTTDISECLKPSGIFIDRDSLVTQYPDVSDFPYNQIVLVKANKASAITNSPWTDKSYYAFTTGYLKTTSAVYGGMIQFAVPFFSSQDNILKYRYYDGSSWSVWYQLGITSGGGQVTYNANPSNFIEIINTAKQTANAVVYLEGGTYNLFDATHDETYWKNNRPATRYCGILLNNGIELIGKGNVIFNGQYTGSDSDIMENFSILNIAGNCKIKNIKMIAQNICYVVHDDQGIAINDATDVLYENCEMTHNGTTHTFQYGAPICIGGGCGPYVKRKIQNCVFSAPTASRHNPTNYHTNNNGHGDILFIGNYFKDGTIRFNYFNGGTIKAIVRDNKLNADVEGKTDTGITCYDWNNITQ